jgi:hypothetical protein
MNRAHSASTQTSKKHIKHLFTKGAHGTKNTGVRQHQHTTRALGSPTNQPQKNDTGGRTGRRAPSQHTHARPQAQRATHPGAPKRTPPYVRYRSPVTGHRGGGAAHLGPATATCTGHGPPLLSPPRPVTTPATNTDGSRLNNRLPRRHTSHCLHCEPCVAGMGWVRPGPRPRPPCLLPRPRASGPPRSAPRYVSTRVRQPLQSTGASYSCAAHAHTRARVR